MGIFSQIILITCCLLSVSFARERTLNSVYDLMLFVFESKGDDPRINPFKNANRECLKEKLKLNQFGTKSVDEDFGLLAATSASFLCSDNKKAAYGASLNQVLSNTPKIDNVECYKRRLQELEPTSVIVKNFVPDSNVKCESPLFSASDLESKNNERLRVFKRLNLLKCVNTEIKETELTELKESILKMMDSEADGIPEEVRQAIYDEMRKEHEEIYKCSIDELVAKFN